MALKVLRKVSPRERSGSHRDNDVQSLSCVRLFATPWTVDCQTPLSMGSPSKNIGVGCHALHQGIFPTQGLNLGLLHCRQILYCLSHQGNPFCGIKGLNMFHVSLSIRTMLKSLKPGVELNFFTMTFVPQSSMRRSSCFSPSNPLPMMGI